MIFTSTYCVKLNKTSNTIQNKYKGAVTKQPLNTRKAVS